MGTAEFSKFAGILNAEFQRIARRDEKDFLSDQCKEIERKKKKKKNGKD